VKGKMAHLSLHTSQKDLKGDNSVFRTMLCHFKKIDERRFSFSGQSLLLMHG
jgi:hypothetical protein